MTCSYGNIIYVHVCIYIYRERDMHNNNNNDNNVMFLINSNRSPPRAPRGAPTEL